MENITCYFQSHAPDTKTNPHSHIGQLLEDEVDHTFQISTRFF